MLSNLSMWHLLVIVGVLVMMAAVVTAIVFVAIRLARRK